jgi:hypothetical protein
MFNRGGQKRTIELPCGKKIIGSVREVSGKINIHRKNCKICIELVKDVGFCEIPEFSKVAANINGWNGIRGDNIPTKMMTTVTVDGVRGEYMVDASSIAEAEKKVKLMVTKKEEEDKEDKIEEEHKNLVDKVIWLLHNSPCQLKANKYSGCELDAMPNAKLKIIINLCEKEINDYFYQSSLTEDKELVEHLRKVENHTCDDCCDCKTLSGMDTKEKVAEFLEKERIENGGNPECPCCIITADRIVYTNIEGSDYCKIIVK